MVSFLADTGTTSIIINKNIANFVGAHIMYDSRAAISTADGKVLQNVGRAQLQLPLGRDYRSVSAIVVEELTEGCLIGTKVLRSTPSTRKYIQQLQKKIAKLSIDSERCTNPRLIESDMVTDPSETTDTSETTDKSENERFVNPSQRINYKRKNQINNRTKCLLLDQPQCSYLDNDEDERANTNALKSQLNKKNESKAAIINSNSPQLPVMVKSGEDSELIQQLQNVQEMLKSIAQAVTPHMSNVFNKCVNALKE